MCTEPLSVDAQFHSLEELAEFLEEYPKTRLPLREGQLLSNKYRDE